MNIFSQRLRQLRNDFRLTGEELGNLVGVNKSTISKYENEERVDPTLTTLKNMAKVFNCTIDYLIGTSDSKNEKINSDGFIKLYDKLTDLNKEKVIHYLRFLLYEQGSDSE